MTIPKSPYLSPRRLLLATIDTNPSHYEPLMSDRAKSLAKQMRATDLACELWVRLVIQEVPGLAEAMERHKEIVP